MALPSESSSPGGWVAPWSYKPAPAPVTPPSFVGPVAPKKYVYAPPARSVAPKKYVYAPPARSVAPQPKPLTPDQKALALARQIANAMPGQTKAALNAGIDLVASLVPSLPTPEFTGSGGGGTSFDMPQPPSLPDFRQEYGNAVTGMGRFGASTADVPTYRLTRGLGAGGPSVMGNPPTYSEPASNQDIAAALPDFRQEYGAAAANMGRFGASSPSYLPAPEPPGAWAEVDPTPTYRLTRGLGAGGPSVMGNAPTYSEPSAAAFIGPIQPPSAASATPGAGLGVFGQGAAAAATTPPGVQAVMPPETPASGSRSYSSRSYTPRSYSSRSYTPRSYSSRSYYPRPYSSYSSGSGTTASATDFSGLPPAYTLAFNTAFNMPIEGYYTAERGGATQAARDYQNIMNLWQSRTGKPMTLEELVRLLTSFDAYTLSLGRNPGWEDFVSYITMMTERQFEPQPVNVSYLGMGNI